MMNMALAYSSPYLSNLSAVHLSQIVQTCGETAIQYMQNMWAEYDLWSTWKSQL